MSYTTVLVRNVLVPLFLALTLSLAAGAQGRINIITTAQCSLTPRNEPQPVTGVTVEIDGKAYSLAGSGLWITLPSGTHTVRATVPYNASARLIYVRAKGGSSLIHQAVNGAATVESDPNGDQWEVRVDSCMVDQANFSRIAVKVTQSCTLDPAENVTNVFDAAVYVGEKTGSTNFSGESFIDVIPGKYPVSAVWKDAVLASVKYNGMEVPNGLEASPPQITVAERTGLLEVRFVTCDPSGGRKARATVTNTNGNMSVRRHSRISNSYTDQDAFVGMVLRDGDWVTSKGGDIQWIGGGSIHFDSIRATSIQIGPDPPNTNGRTIGGESIKLLKGAVRYIIEPFMPSTRKPYTFDSSTGTVWCTVKGTDFTLAYDDQAQISTVSVNVGTVELTPLNASIPAFVLNSGQASEVSLAGVRSIPVDNATGGGVVVPQTTGIAGTWLYQGRSDRPANIELSGNSLVFRNEKGDVSRGHFETNDVVVAENWGNLRGRLNSQHTRISWANGSFWTRAAVDGTGGGTTGPILAGTWFFQGRTDRPASVDQSGNALVFRNEKGDVSRGHFESSNVVVAETWGNLRGRLDPQNTRIDWANGSFWTRSGAGGSGDGTTGSNIGGTWFYLGKTDRPANVEQNGNSLVFKNEKGDISRGRFESTEVVVAESWGNLKGRLDPQRTRIDWANGSFWTRAATGGSGNTNSCSGGPNLALRCPAGQSSPYPYTGTSTPEGAVDGIKNSGWGFHTDNEVNPWWQVDLGAIHTITEVRIFNRMDCCSERARTIQVLLSNDGRNWTRVFANDGTVFGGQSDGKPLRVMLNSASGRYVRLQLNEKNNLHLDEVEVYGR